MQIVLKETISTEYYSYKYEILTENVGYNFELEI